MNEENKEVNKEENKEEEKLMEEAVSAVNNNSNNQAELEAKDQEIEELNDRYKRLFAEFENYKKRTAKDKENIYGNVTGDVVSIMLPIMDNLEKASIAKTDDTKYQEGIQLIARQFQDALKNLGLEEIETVGQRFDPQFHEAVSHVDDETKGDQEIVEEYRKGYKIGNKVIRHSMVIVAN